MPACYALSRIGDETDTYVKLVTIDEEMCAFFGVTPDPVLWFRNWENTIGLGLAMGHSWDKIREVFADSPRQIEVVNWLEANFKPHAWYQRGR